jgi:hypothetical protein
VTSIAAAPGAPLLRRTDDSRTLPARRSRSAPRATTAVSWRHRVRWRGRATTLRRRLLQTWRQRASPGAGYSYCRVPKRLLTVQRLQVSPVLWLVFDYRCDDDRFWQPVSYRLRSVDHRLQTHE